MTTNTSTALDPTQLFTRLVELFHEESSIKDDIKQLLDEAKEVGIENVTAIKQAAKIRAEEKDADWVDKMTTVKEVLDNNS